MNTLTFKWWMVALCLVLVTPLRAQISDQLTVPNLSKDMASYAARVGSFAVAQRLEDEAQVELTEFTEEWMAINDSIQDGLRLFGAGVEEGSEPESSVGMLEVYWLARGLWGNIRQMISLYDSFLDRLDNTNYAFAALREETLSVFMTQGYNSIELLDVMLQIIKDQAGEYPQMSIRQCYDLGDEMNKRVTEINLALKAQLIRVDRFAALRTPDKLLDIVGRYDPAVKNR